MSLLEGLALFLLLLSGVLVVTLRNAIHAALARKASGKGVE